MVKIYWKIFFYDKDKYIFENELFPLGELANVNIFAHVK